MVTTKNHLSIPKGSRDTDKGLFAPQAAGLTLKFAAEKEFADEVITKGEQITDPTLRATGLR